MIAGSWMEDNMKELKPIIGEDQGTKCFALVEEMESVYTRLPVTVHACYG